MSINGDVRPAQWTVPVPGFCASMHSVPQYRDEL